MRIANAFGRLFLAVVVLGGGLLVWYYLEGGPQEAITGADNPNAIGEDMALDQPAVGQTNSSTRAEAYAHRNGSVQKTCFLAASAHTGASQAQPVLASISANNATDARCDTAVLDDLLINLQDSDHSIRIQALDKIKQLDQVVAVPRLKAFAETTDNQETKDEIQEAIEFLELPSYEPETSFVPET